MKKILEDHKLKQERELKSSRASVFTSYILLFFVFLATVWGILLVYWLYFWGGTDLKIGVAWAGVLAFIIVGWIWAFFLLWDTENNICRFFALLITGFVFGGAIVLSRILYGSSSRPYQKKEGWIRITIGNEQQEIMEQRFPEGVYPGQIMPVCWSGKQVLLTLS